MDAEELSVKELDHEERSSEVSNTETQIAAEQNTEEWNPKEWKAAKRRETAARWRKLAAGPLLPFCILIMPFLFLSPFLSLTGVLHPLPMGSQSDASIQAKSPGAMTELHTLKKLESIRDMEDATLFPACSQESRPEKMDALSPAEALTESGADAMETDALGSSETAEETELKAAIVVGEAFSISEEEEWVPVKDPLTAEELLATALQDGSLIEETVHTNPAETEAEIYRFLKSALGLNTAAVCGILANIDAESRFYPTVEILDTNHLLSFGLCQWNGGRYTALKEYCAAHGCDYRTVDGQLQYLQYELQHGESHALSVVKRVENTREGAFFAAYHWASLFERCASRYFEGRAKLAWNVYWGRYSGIPAEQETGSLVYLNLSGNLNGTDTDSLESYGKVDVYINGALSARGVSDYDRAWPNGVQYELRNIQAEDGYTYLGVSTGELTGQVGNNVRLKFSGSAPGTPVAVTLHPMDGTVDPASLTVLSGEVFGSLPTPVRDGYTFDGWLTESGQSVTETTIMTGDMAAAGSMTIFASWTEVSEESPPALETEGATNQTDTIAASSDSLSPEAGAVAAAPGAVEQDAEQSGGTEPSQETDTPNASEELYDASGNTDTGSSTTNGGGASSEIVEDGMEGFLPAWKWNTTSGSSDANTNSVTDAAEAADAESASDAADGNAVTDTAAADAAVAESATEAAVALATSADIDMASILYDSSDTGTGLAEQGGETADQSDIGDGNSVTEPNPSDADEAMAQLSGVETEVWGAPEEESPFADRSDSEEKSMISGYNTYADASSAFSQDSPVQNSSAREEGNVSEGTKENSEGIVP